MTDESEHFTIKCADCGEEYDPREEVAEDHDDDCPVYHALRQRGQTSEAAE